MGEEASLAKRREIVAFIEADCARLHLHYFFQLVFKHRICFETDAQRLSQDIGKVEWPKLFVACPLRYKAPALRLVEQLSQLEQAPFILCLAKPDDDVSNESLFEAGANEVFRLPISLKEIAYRLRSRSAEIGLPFSFEPNQAKSMDFGGDVIRRAELTQIEAQVMLVLLEQGGGIVTRDALSIAIDNQPWTYGNRKFDVHIASIRKKLDVAYDGALDLRTIRSAGYQLTVSEPAS